MTIGKKIEQLRTGDLVLHCVQVEVFQKMDDGLKMSGHGTIKVNNVGTIYMEFICIASENVPRTLFSDSLPKDPLNDDHKLYLRAQTIDGDVYESDGFSIKINMNSSRPLSITISSYRRLIPAQLLKHMTQQKLTTYILSLQSISTSLRISATQWCQVLVMSRTHGIRRCLKWVIIQYQ